MKNDEERQITWKMSKDKTDIPSDHSFNNWVGKWWQMDTCQGKG